MDSQSKKALPVRAITLRLKSGVTIISFGCDTAQALDNAGLGRCRHHVARQIAHVHVDTNRRYAKNADGVFEQIKDTYTLYYSDGNYEQCQFYDASEVARHALDINKDVDIVEKTSEVFHEWCQTNIGNVWKYKNNALRLYFPGGHSKVVLVTDVKSVEEQYPNCMDVTRADTRMRWDKNKRCWY